MKNKTQKKILSRSEKVFDILSALVCVIITLFTIYPLYYIIISSMSKPYYVDNGQAMFWFKGFNFESYIKAFQIDGLWMAYGNTIFYTVVGVIVSMIFTVTAAYALSRERLIGRKFFTLMMVFTMWFNAGMIPFYLTIKDFRMLNKRSTIIIAFAINAYNLIIMKSFFEQLPKSLEEAAFIDGASNFKIFLQIFVPLSKPALATVAMFYAVNRWNSYFWAMNILRDDDKMPLQVLLKKLIVDRTSGTEEAGIVTNASMYSPLTVIYAVIVIAILPMLIVYPFIQKYFQKGMTIGAVKG